MLKKERVLAASAADAHRASAIEHTVLGLEQLDDARELASLTLTALPVGL